jgi:arylsulfatase A-like enzyme
VTPLTSGEQRIGPLTADNQRRWAWRGDGAGRFEWRLPGSAGELRISCAGPAGRRVRIRDVISGEEQLSPPLAAGWNDLDFALEPARGSRQLEVGLAGCPEGEVCGWGDIRFEPTRRARREEPLNLLFVLIDTTRFDAIGAYGSRNSTPIIDGIARQGVLFERMYAQCSWTLPSVSSLLTGRWPNESPGWRLGKSVPDSAIPLAELLQIGGFHTAAFVANPLLTEEAGFGRGFETFWGSPLSDSVFTPAEAVAERASGWLATHQSERFFMYLHFMDPHDPYAPPARRPRPGQPWPGTSDPAFLGAAPFPDRPTLASWHELYEEEVAYVDGQLGRVLGSLAPEVRERTAIVVTADHGEEFLEHGFLKHGVTLFDEVVRVPFVMSVPKRVTAPSRVPELARLVDVVPTLIDLLAVNVPSATRASWAGVSLAPAITGHAPMPRLITQGETFGWGALRWYVSDGRSKVVFYNPGFRIPKTSADPFTKHWIEANTPREAVYQIADAAPWDRRIEPPPPSDLSWARELAGRYGVGRAEGLWVLVRGLGKGERFTVELDLPSRETVGVIPLFWRPDETFETASGRMTLHLLDDGVPRIALLAGATAEMATSLRVSSSLLPGSQWSRRPGADRSPGVYWWWQEPPSRVRSDEELEALKRLHALGYGH